MTGGTETSFSARRRLLADRLQSLGLDAVLLSRGANVRYLTGFTGSSGLALMRLPGAEVTLVTDGRYAAAAARESPDVRCEVTRRTWSTLASVLAENRVEVLGVEAHDLSLEAAGRLDSATGGESGSPVRTVDIARAVESVRRVKDAGEISLLRQACEVAEAALGSALTDGVFRAGATEQGVAAELEFRMRQEGAHERAFPTIVAFGEFAAEPHHSPTGRALRRGDLVKVDFGARVAGYHSDMTRTFVLGPAAAWQRELHSLVLDAQQQAIMAVRADASLSEVDAVARRRITAADHGQDFPHGLGHGVGLEVHEEPILSEQAAGTLGDRYVVTVEPGVYLPGLGGVRIEDMVVVRPDGFEMLTSTPRDLISL